MSMLWIGGWGIAPAWGLAQVEARFPDMEHVWRAPSADVLGDVESFDRLAGYSLGANLLLRMGLGYQALLLAPFMDFKKEAGLGGRVSLTQLRYLQRWLRRNPLDALNDFFERAALAYRATELPYAKEDLLWGLEQLMADTDAGIARGCTAMLGLEDPLLDTEALSGFFEKTERLSGVGHDLAGLLRGVPNPVLGTNS